MSNALFEAARNLPYPEFAETFLSIVDKKGRARPFIRNTIQKKYNSLKILAKRRGYKRFLALKYRRGGITTEEQAQSFYRILRNNMSAFTLAHTIEDTITIFKIINNYYTNLPEQVQPERSQSRKKTIEFPTLNSRLTVGTAKAKASARGSTLQKVHGSEVAFWPGQTTDIDSLIASLGEACSEGEVVLETTANGYNHYYELWKSAKTNSESEWVGIFLPWFQDPTNSLPLVGDEETYIHDTLAEDEKFLIEHHGLTFDQVKWRRRKQIELPRLFLQEYPEDDETAFLLTGRVYFDKDLVTKGLNACVSPKQMPGGYSLYNNMLSVWRGPKPGRQYVIGADVASGTSGGKDGDLDWSVAFVLDKRSGQHMATLTCQLKPHDFAVKCVDLAKKYNNALLGFERQQHGHAAISFAEFDLNYPNLYKHVEYNYKGKTIIEQKKQTGWPTSSKTRPIMLDRLAKLLLEQNLDCLDSRLWEEMGVFVADTHGKWGASNGEHDDHIFAYGIAQCIRDYEPTKPTMTVVD